MSSMPHQIREEAKQLPLKLVKLVGGLAAVIGFGAAAWTATRSGDAGSGEILLALISGCAGILVFLLSSQRISRSAPQTQTGCGGKTRQSLLAWSLLLLFVCLFLAFVRAVTG
jgi:zinc transporter ZupT